MNRTFSVGFSITCLWFLVGLGQGFSAETAAKPQAASKVKATKFDDWYMRCVPPKEKAAAQSCEVAQVAQVNDNGKAVTVLTIAFGKDVAPPPPKDKKAKQAPGVAGGLTMTALVPLNVFLPAGISLKLDGKELPLLVYRNCNDAGCWSQIKITKAEVSSLYAKAKTASAKLQLMGGQNVNITFSTKGLASALEELSKN